MEPLFGNQPNILSASDQPLTRQINTSTKFSILGKTYEIRPPSHWLCRVIAEYKLEHEEKQAREKLSAKTLRDSLDVADEKASAANELDQSLKIFRETIKLLWQIEGVTDEFAIRFVQLILLDAEKPDWKDTAKGFPSRELLDTVVPYEKLFRFSSPVEMNALIELYNEMQKPAEMRKNFQRWGLMEALMRDSVGQGSGASS